VGAADLNNFEPKFLLNFPFGLFVGCVATSLFGWMVQADFATWLTGNGTAFIGPLATLVAASIAIAGVVSTISFQWKQSEQARLGKLSAARAALPQALSEICRLSERSFDVMCRYETETKQLLLEGKLSGDEVKSIAAEFDFVSSVLSIVMGSIEHADSTSRQRLMELLAWHQICASRSRAALFDPTTGHLKYSPATDWLGLYSMAQNCFEFSRGQAQSIPSHLENYRPMVMIFSREWELYRQYPGLKDAVRSAARSPVFEKLLNGSWSSVHL
jgi:hypothetical protein